MKNLIKSQKKVLEEENQTEESNSIIGLKGQVQELREALDTAPYNVLRGAFGFMPDVVYEKYNSAIYCPTGDYVVLKEKELAVILGRKDGVEVKATLNDVTNIIWDCLHRKIFWIKAF